MNLVGTPHGCMLRHNSITFGHGDSAPSWRLVSTGRTREGD